MNGDDRVNILLVDDQPAKLLSYEVILQALDETLLKATSARDALDQLLRNDVAVVLMDVSMPDLDGFQLAAMIRDHPRFQQTPIIFVSAIHLTELDFLRGYEMGAVDYVPVPVVPEVLRAKVRVFAELHRKSRQLEQLNRELESRVAERTRELEASSAKVRESEERRNLALAAGQMGSWDWDLAKADCRWDEGQHRIFGVDPQSFAIDLEHIAPLIPPEDLGLLQEAFRDLLRGPSAHQVEFRVRRPNGELRWCIGASASSADETGKVVRLSGVTIDITERKDAENRQALLAREVDHRAKNALALVQSIVRLSKADTLDAYVTAVDGRIKALSRAHTLLAQSRWQGADLTGLLSEELAPYRGGEGDRIEIAGPAISLEPRTAQSIGLALHELATNAAKYGALSSHSGRLVVSWALEDDHLLLTWTETDGPSTPSSVSKGFGLRVITASIEQQLEGKATFSWTPHGLKCTLSIPVGLSADLVPLPEDAAEADEEPAMVRKRRGAGKPMSTGTRRVRVLLVEDEVLVGIMMQDLLRELGCKVVGPFAGAQEANAALREGGVDVAILDINLGRELVYPLADILVRRKVPFFFVTGYAAETVDARFGSVPVLEKPVDSERLKEALAKSSKLAWAQSAA
jgi:PAS domain S-box-containing protein